MKVKKCGLKRKKKTRLFHRKQQIEQMIKLPTTNRCGVHQIDTLCDMKRDPD